MATTESNIPVETIVASARLFLYLAMLKFQKNQYYQTRCIFRNLQMPKQAQMCPEQDSPQMEQILFFGFSLNKCNCLANPNENIT